MSDQRFKDAKGSLAFSQGLRDRMRAAQQPPQDQEMAQEAPPAPEQAPAPEAPPVAPPAPVEQLNTPPETEAETPQEDATEPVEKDIPTRIKDGLQGMEKFFTSIGDYFKSEETKDADRAKKGEQTLDKLKSIEKSLKQIVEE